MKLNENTSAILKNFSEIENRLGHLIGPIAWQHHDFNV